jgi:uncharacterized protein YcfJ
METSYDSYSQALSRADLREKIRRRAEEIYYRSGRVVGRDLENWSQAEREIRLELERTNRRTAVVVRIDGVQYVGEYRTENAEGYIPGEIGPGAPVPIRFDGEKMFVKRPNGKELETRIVQKVG